MNTTRLSLTGIGHTASAFLVISYLLCIGFDMVFPQHAMYRAWQDLLPGFEFITFKGFIIGLIEVYLYGWYFAVVCVPLYNFFNRDTTPSTNT